MRHLLRPTTVCAVLVTAGAAGALPLDRFEEGRQDHGFTCRHLYLDARGRTAGACLEHESGFLLDLLPMETAPQAFVWISTPVTGHRGEPHTLEHLLLGKGRRGLSVANAEEFRLSGSSAFTGQLETCYHFSTALGPEAFLVEFGDRLDALLHPDFSDEEIRREVCHVGPKEGPDGLELEEKGTVYTEMVSSWDHPWGRAAQPINEALYGPDHPLAAYQGGKPEGIRMLEPRHIREFQASTHFLANMGAQLVVPPGAANEPLLAQLDSLLRALEPRRPQRPTRHRGELPPIQPVRDPLCAVVDVPGVRTGEPALLLAAWPQARPLDPAETLLAQFFLSVCASGESSDLYQHLVDPARAEDALGAAWISAWLDDEPARTVWLALGSLPAERVTEAGLAEIRGRVAARLAEIAAWEEGEPQLASLKERALALAASQRRAGRTLLDHPPGFGQRGTGSFWADHLRRLRGRGGFQLRLDEGPALDEAEARLLAPGNPFSGLMDDLRLIETPHVTGTRSDPALLEQKERGRLARLDAFADSLARAHGVDDRQEALRRFAAAYDQTTAELEVQRAGLPVPELPAELPLDADPDFPAESGVLVEGVPVLHGVFEGMVGAGFHLAFRAPDTPWVAVLPALLTESGLRGPSGVMDFRQVEDALRREVAWAGCWLDADLESGRAELVLSAVGADPEECVTALGWVERFLAEADLSEANRPRLREIVRRQLANLRQTRQGAEESWVEVPAAAWARRDDARLLRAGCFLTQERDLFRCAWALESPDDRVDALLEALEHLPERQAMPPDSCRALLEALRSLPEEERAGGWPRRLGLSADPPLDAEALRITGLALDDLAAFAAELPAATFAGDWRGLVADMREADVPPLASLRMLTPAAERRAWFTGPRTAWETVRPHAERLAGRLGGSDAPAASSNVRPPHVVADGPVAVGLPHPGSSTGVAILRTPLAWQHAWTPDDALDHLSGNLLGGGGDQGLFMQTWAAGLAYSNGIRPRERTGVLRYYAERCPDLDQTLTFVEERIRQAPVADAGRARMALVTALGGDRSAQGYGERTRQRALDLQWADTERGPRLLDGQGTASPSRLDDVRGFRGGLLQAARRDDLPAELERRKTAVHARLFPGLAPGGWTAPAGTQLFFLGPDRQLELADNWLAARASGLRVHRVAPRDYWVREERP